MADDIVTRLRAAHPLQYGDLNGRLVENAECNDDPQIRDRVNRCWKCQQWSPCDVREAADEIERLRGEVDLFREICSELAEALHVQASLHRVPVRTRAFYTVHALQALARWEENDG
jgi:hypothetical protein